MKLIFAAFIFTLSAVLISSPDKDGNLLINARVEQSKNGIMPDNWNGDNHIYSLSNESVSGMHSLKYFCL